MQPHERQQLLELGGGTDDDETEAETSGDEPEPAEDADEHEVGRAVAADVDHDARRLLSIPWVRRHEASSGGDVAAASHDRPTSGP